MFPSLVASYDALTRNHFILAEGEAEDEFRRFVASVQKAYSHWIQTEKDFLRIKEDLRKCQQEKATLETELKHARSQIKLEFQKRTQVENDRNTLEKLMSMIQSLLNDKNKSILDEKDMQKLAYFNSYQRSNGGKKRAPENRMRESSASCLSDISYDMTDDDLDASVTKDLQSGSTPPKKKRTSTDADTSIVTRTSVHVDPKSGKPQATTTTHINMPKLNKSFSEPMLDVQFKKAGCESDEEEVWTLRPGQTPRSRKRNSKSPRHQRTQSESDSPFLRKANSASSGLNKMHIFISKTVIRPEYCQPCGAKIKFGKMAMRCKECKMICHSECKNQLSLPCIPLLVRTPGVGKDYSGVLADYAPVYPPFVPGIVVHLVAEVERRGLNEVGIYRISGAERQVKELKEKFWKGKSTPNLSLVEDINVVCSCLKDFLRSLKESLITYKLWPAFVKVVSENCSNNLNILYSVINELPPSNRDTLAFLVKHLQLVGQTETCRMPIKNLAKVFGPTIVGFSHPEPEAKDILQETKLQAMVMEQLLLLPTDYWNSFLQSENFLDENMPLTPEDKQVLHSMLGPVGITPTSSSSSKLNDVKPTPKFLLRHKNINKGTKTFFDSPTLE